MGHMRDHAIIVSSWDRSAVAAAHAKAVELFAELVTPIMDGTSNAHTSFMVAPDGSKEGWPESDRLDALRDEYVAWLPEFASWAHWVEVQFADDDSITRIVRHSDDDNP